VGRLGLQKEEEAAAVLLGLTIVFDRSLPLYGELVTKVEAEVDLAVEVKVGSVAEP
jgi:hypothetical protein